MASVVGRHAFAAFAEVAAEYFGEVDGGRRIRLPTIGVTVTIETDTQPILERLVAADVVAAHDELDEPIRFTSVGVGEHTHVAAVAGARQWFEVVFPVLHYLYADHETNAVSTAKIDATNRRTGRRFAWLVVQSPVRTLVRGPSDTPRGEPGDILYALKHEVTGISASSKPFWIDAFVAINDDDSITAECRLLNKRWDEATRRLEEVAREMLPKTNGFRSWRQFMFFVPKDPDEARVEKVEWWKRFFAR